MNKKLILLILCLPLILMLSLFSVSKSVSITFSIPVSKIEIFGDRIIYMDLDSMAEYLVDYTIYPTNAKNKKVYLQTEPVGSAPFAQLEYQDGKIIAKSCGKAKAYLVTVDGGFRDSFIVQVDSNKLQSINCEILKSSIYVGDTTQIVTTFEPTDSNSLLEYQLSDEAKKIVSVNAMGVVTGLAKGNAEIVVVSTIDSTVKDMVMIEVKNRDIVDLEKTTITTWRKEGSVNLSLDTNEECEYVIKVYNENMQELTPQDIDISLNLDNSEEGRISVDYKFIDKTYNGSALMEITVKTESGLEVTKTCTISCINQISASFDNEELSQVKYGSTIIQSFTIMPNDVEVEMECNNSNTNISIVLDNNNNLIFITGEKLGVSIISLTIYNKENRDEFVTLTKEVVVTTLNININESAKTYGIENLLAFAKTEVNGNASVMNLSLSYGGATLGEDFTSYITWISSSANANIDNIGNISLLGNTGKELVTFKAKFSYKNINIESNGFTINCVYDGVNVRNYLDLWNATNTSHPKPIVLHNDIKDDFAVGVNNYYKEIATTYDNTYYQNIDKLDKAKIKILIEFKNDVYGNGYTINAHNVAWSKNLQNATTNAVFSGPLNFVAMSENGGMISVKAQDNVCFAVYENVTLSNIVLKGCDLQADSNNEYDLNDLTYTGTTVEVFGDNVNIQHSRITNGRTVLRAFGDINDKTKNIHLNIANSVLSGAREFILRLGTNCFVDGSVAEPSPCLPDDTTNSFPAQKTYELMDDAQKQDYDTKFIKTFVTVKNSVFKDAGIFAIGLDTHFAGDALADGSSYLGGLVKDWYNLAKTSYGVKLTFEGDVRMYNWKSLDDVDSSTLIEVLGPTSFSDISFNVAEMVEAISNKERFKNIIYQQDASSTKYVHAGIAFFGGGKNYSVFEDSDYITYDFNGYDIKLSDVNKESLQVAAGNESFYFLLNDATSKTFLPQHQEEILNSNDAYLCIYK